MNYYLNGSFTVQATDSFQVLPVGSSYIASAADVDVEVTVVPPGTEYAAPLVVLSPPSQIPGISNGLPMHTGAAAGSSIAATNIDSDGSGATFAYLFDAGGVLIPLICDGAGTG